jgi:WD40 repeat protein
MTYKAFISYSHAADGQLAPAIQSALQSFAKPWYKLRSILVFRDKTTLAMTPKLWPSIQAALDESEYFILLASVDSGRSPWVEREVEYWLQQRAPDKLLIVVTDSSPLTPQDTTVDFGWIRENLLPLSLRNSLCEVPLYLDLRWVKSQDNLSARNPRFLDDIAGLSSTLTGKSKDVLTGEDVRQHRKLRRLTWSAAILLALLTIASLVAASVAIWQLNTTRARGLVAASRASEDIDPEISVLTAAHGVAATSRWDRSHIPDSEQQLHRAILTSGLRLELMVGDTVSSVAWSPDGKRVVTASADHTINVWDALSGRNLMVLSGHSRPIRSVAWSPDGKQIASGSEDKTAKIWDALTGKEIRTLIGHSDTVDTVAWAPDGQRLATGSWDDTAIIWQAESGQSVRTLKGHRLQVRSVTWSPDGKWLATGSQDQAVKIWDSTTGEQRATLGRHTGLMDLVSGGAEVESVAWSPNGYWLATGSDDKATTIWDMSDGGKEFRVLRGHTGNVLSVAWSPDSGTLATASDDHSVKTWDVRAGKELLTLRGHSGPVRSVTWSPDGTRVFSGSVDKSARVWDSRGGQEFLALRPDHGPVKSVIWSPDGKKLATAFGFDDETPKVWDSESGKELPLELPSFEIPPPGENSFGTHMDGASIMVWSPDGKRLALIDNINQAEVWDPQAGKELPLNHETTQISDMLLDATCVAWSPDGRLVATGSWHDEAPTPRIWEAASGKEVMALVGHHGRIYTLAWSPDSKRLVTGSNDHTAIVWEAGTGKKLLTLSHGDIVNSVAWSLDGKRVVTGSNDNTAKIWDALTGTLRSTLSGHYDNVLSVAFSPDGKRLATGSRDQTTKIWDVESGKELLTLIGHNDSVSGVAWSPNGKLLATGSNDGTVQVYTMDIRDLMTLARQRVTAHPSEEGCRKYLQFERCPPVP